MKYLFLMLIVLSILMSCTKESNSIKIEIIENKKFSGFAIGDNEIGDVNQGLKKLFENLNPEININLADSICNNLDFKNDFNAKTNSFKFSITEGFLTKKNVLKVEVLIKRDLNKFRRNGYAITYPQDNPINYEFLKNTNKSLIVKIGDRLLHLDTISSKLVDENKNIVEDINLIKRFDSNVDYVLTSKIFYKNSKIEKHNVNYTGEKSEFENYKTTVARFYN